MRYLAVGLTLLAAPCLLQAQGGRVEITGDVPHPVTLGDAALQSLPRQHVQFTDHGRPSADYEGVPVRLLLQQAGVDLSSPLRGAALARAVVIDASDGYRVVFAISEFDESIGAKVILLADRKDGQMLDDHEGPFRILAPSDGRPARSVREVTAIRVIEIPAPR